MVVQIPTYLLSALNIFVVLPRKGQDLGWGTVTWIKPLLPAPISASRFPTELEFENVLQRLAAGPVGAAPVSMHLPNLQRDKPMS